MQKPQKMYGLFLLLVLIRAMRLTKSFNSGVTMWKYYAENAEKFENKISEAFKARSAAERKGFPSHDKFFAENSKEIDSYCKSAAINYVKAIKAVPLGANGAEIAAKLGLDLSSVLDTRAGFAKELLDETVKSKNTKQIESAKSLVKETELFKENMLNSVKGKVLDGQIDLLYSKKVEMDQSQSLSAERGKEKDPIENIINSRSSGKNNDRGVSL